MSRELLKEFTNRIEKIAFSIPAPNNYTPRLIEEVVAIRLELAKPEPVPTPTGYTGVGLDLISLEEFEKLQTGMKLLYDTPLYEHPPAQQDPLLKQIT